MTSKEQFLPKIKLKKNTAWREEEVNGETVQVPVGWGVAHTSEHFDVSMGTTILSSEIVKTPQNGFFPVYSATEKRVIFGYLNNETHNKKTLNVSDIVLGARGTIGFPKVMTEESFSTQTTIQMRSKGTFKSNLFKFLSDQKNQSYYNIEGGGVPMLTVRDVEKIQLLTPTIPEQTLIAQVLSTQEERVQHIRTLINFEKKRLQYLSHELLSGRLLVSETGASQEIKNEAGEVLYTLPQVKLKKNTAWREEEVNGEVVQVPVGWGVNVMSNLFNIYGGGTPSTANAEYWGGNIVWIGPKFMGDNQRYVDVRHPESKKITDKGAKTILPHPIPKGSLIVSSRAPVGYANLAPCDLYTNQGCYSFVPKNNISNCSYFYFWFRNNKKLLESRSSGTTFLEISRAATSKLESIVPPLPEQNLIAQILSNQEERIHSLEEEAQMEEKRLNYLSQELLSGRLLAQEDKQ